MISSTINPVGPSGNTYGKHDVKDFTLNVSKTGIEFRQRHFRLLVIRQQLSHGSAFPTLILISQDCHVFEVVSPFGSSGFSWSFPGRMFLKRSSCISNRNQGCWKRTHLDFTFPGFRSGWPGNDTGSSCKSLAVLLRLKDLGQQPCSPFMVICCSWVSCICTLLDVVEQSFLLYSLSINVDEHFVICGA